MIEVLLFAQLQETAGQGKIKLEADGTSIGALKEKLKQEYGLHQIDKAMIAVNEEYQPEETIIQPGDTIAFIPPVSGG